MNADKPIVLTVVIYPPKKNKRAVIVSGAPEGEMPLALVGLFQDRHALLDQAYGAVLKRDPQLVTIKEPATKKIGKSKSITAGVDDEDETEETETSDQMVTGDAAPVSPSTEAEDLHAIEGDDAPPEEDAVKKFEAQLISLSNADAGEEVEHGEHD